MKMMWVKLLRVCDIMIPREHTAIVSLNSTLVYTITQISKYGHGLAVVIDDKNEVKGVFSDSDLRRQFETRADIYNARISDVMTKNQVCVNSETLAAESFSILRSKKILAAPVKDSSGKLCGVLTLYNLTSAGLVI